jgi:predicted transcriptional regulator
MLTKNISPDLHSFIEATLDSDRLKLISFLTEESFSVLDLAEKIGENPAAIMRHLEVLVEANLVKAINQDGETIYRFDSKELELMARRQLSQPQNEIDFSSLDLSEEHQVFIQNYTRSDGSLKMIPTQLKKINAIMEYISRVFEFDAFYSEKEVNTILNHYHPDSTTLRRHLVDYGYLGRERNGSRYWRVDKR